jgi:hypothetical protein
MTISKENKEFLEGLIEYYISEAESYREMAQEYNIKIDSVSDTTFGIIVGCIYSSFLQTYSNQKLTPDVHDVQEFTEIIMIKSNAIMDAVKGQNN